MTLEDEVWLVLAESERAGKQVLSTDEVCERFPNRERMVIVGVLLELRNQNRVVSARNINARFWRACRETQS